MLLIFNLAEKKLLNLRVEGSEPPVLVCVREVDICICTGRYNVEFRVEHIDSMDNTVQSRHCESHVAFILSNSVLADKHNKKTETQFHLDY